MVHAAPAAGMQAVLDKDLMAMKVTELKEELAARGEALSGNKAWLCAGGCTRLICALIVGCSARVDCHCTFPRRHRGALPRRLVR